MKPLVILENIRSAYNVGNIIRTADALGYDVILSGFSPSPRENESVKKTSLGAEESVNLQQFRYSQEALDWAKKQDYILIAAEVVEGESIDISGFGKRRITRDEIATSQASCNDNNEQDDDVLQGKLIAIIFGNENTGVLQETLEQVDHIIHIPMQGEKESLNVGQAAAIMMREIKKMRN